MKKLMTAAIFAALFLTSCATPYQSKGLMGGFSSTQFSTDTFEVSFGGNGFTTTERTRDYILLRASEICLQKGFSYFVVLEGNVSTIASQHITSGYAHTTGRFYRGGYSGTTFYTPPTQVQINRPIGRAIIKCFTEKPTCNHFDAAFIQQSMRNKYEIQ